MQRPEFSESQWQWDAFREFYTRQNCTVYFKTGEVICTAQAPSIDTRHSYPGGLRIDTTNESGPLWAPDGRELKNAWLYDNGMQHLFVDEEANRCVRLDGGGMRYRVNGKQGAWSNPSGTTPAEYLPGVPERFQTCAYAYIGGPGCHLVGAGMIVAWVPLAKAISKEEREHCAMIENTARAAMKLTDHKAIGSTVAGESISKGCPLAFVLSAQTWQDIPEHKLAELYWNGTQRAKWEFDWCYYNPPAHAIDA